jgi:tetratricopeptide (TPR) repeat protein
MVKSLRYSLSLLIPCCLLFSCQKRDWYKREFSASEKEILSVQLVGRADVGPYYQGSVPCQFLLREAIEMNPQNPDAWREINAPYVKRGFGVENYKTFGKVVELAPKLWQGWRGYLYLYFYRDYERAIADFDATDTLTSITDYPQGQSVDYMRGLCYYALYENEKALKYFTANINEVTKKNGEEWVDVYAFLYRGLTYERLNQKELAIKDFDRGMKYASTLTDFPFHKTRLLLDDPKSDPIELSKLFQAVKRNFSTNNYHQRSYVEVHDQLYEEDITALEAKVFNRIGILKN